MNNFALIVGVGADLPTTITDAQGLHAILTDPLRCAYPEDNVVLLTGDDATRSNILDALDQLAEVTQRLPDSTVMIYFSGHGCIARTSIGESYFMLPYGYDIYQLLETAVSGTEFADKLSAIHCARLLLLLDCCHSGSITEDNTKAPGISLLKAPLPPEAQRLFARGGGRVMVASSRADEVSYTGQPYSLFTRALIECLAGQGVSRLDGYVRALDLAMYAREKVPSWSNGRQHPIADIEQADNFAVAYYAAGEKTPLPVELPDPGATDLTIVRQKYLQWLIDRNLYLDPRGMAQTRRTVTLKLDEVYVTLRGERRQEGGRTVDDEINPNTVIPNERAQRTAKQNKISAWPDGAQDKLRQASATRVTLARAVLESPRLVILGDPGAGKTTLARYLALRFARSMMTGAGATVVSDGDGNEYGQPALPVLVRVADYATAFAQDRTLTLRRYLPKLCLDAIGDETAAANLLDDALVRNEALIILDGLDEIVDAGDRARIARQIESFVHGARHNRFVITSRRVGYAAAPLGGEFEHFLMLPMQQEEIQRFLERWCGAVERFHRPETPSADLQAMINQEVESIMWAVNANQGVKRLAENPLMLTLLALIRRNRTHLPNRRIELYELAVKTLLEDWELARGIPEAHLVKENEALRLLGPLALWLHETKPTGMASERELRERLGKELGNWRGAEPESQAIEEAVDDFLRRVREHSGVLVERAPRRYGFMHLTFEEYFAARELVRRRAAAVKRIYDHRHQARWEEPILLAIAYVSQESPEDAEEMIRLAILGQDEDGEYEQSQCEEILQRDLLLAVRCIADCAGLRLAWSRPQVERLTQIACGRHRLGRYSPLRRRANTCLAALYDTLPGLVAIDALLTALRDPDWKVRGFAVEALSTVGRGSERVIAGLIEAMHDSVGYVRANAIEALSAGGVQNEAVMNALLAAVEDSEGYVRASAAAALGALGRRNEQALDKLRAAMEDENLDVRQRAEEALSTMQMRPKSVDDLLDAMIAEGEAQPVSGEKDTNHDLGDLGNTVAQPTDPSSSISTTGEQALHDLLAILRDEAWSVNEADEETMAATQLEGGRAVDELLLAMRDERDYVRARAAEALGVAVNKTDEVVRSLLTALKDKSPDVRARAVEALGALGLGGDRVVKGLVNALNNDRNSAVRQNAVAALSALGQESERVVNALLEAMHDQDSLVRERAVEALGLLGPENEAAINGLLAALQDSDPQVIARSADGIVKLCGNRQPTYKFPAALRKKIIATLRSVLESPKSDSEGLFFIASANYNNLGDVLWETLWQAVHSFA